VPPKFRKLAKIRTEHLGLSSLDLITAQEEERQQNRETAAGRAASRIPNSLATKSRDTVSGLLGKTSQKNRIRLDGMTEAFVVPLEKLRSKKRYLLSDQLPSTLDCLALAYLSLAIVPDLPVSWLRDAVTTQSAGVVGYTERLRTTCFGGRVDLSMAFASPDSVTPTDGRHRLPWQAPARLNVGGIGLRVWEAVLDSIPVVRDIRTSRRLQQVGQEQFPAGQEQEMVLQIARAQRYNTYLSVGTVVGGVGLMVWYMFSAGLLAINRGEPTELEEEEEEADGHQPQPSAFGDAGSILGI
jgi:sorting and assembly machinery component 37